MTPAARGGPLICRFARQQGRSPPWNDWRPPLSPSAPMETTLIIVKPDGVQRGLVGRIINRFEEKGLQIAGLKLMRISTELAATHYDAAQGEEVLPGPRPVHDFVSGRRAGAPRHQRDRDLPQDDGRDVRLERRARHHPRRLRGQQLVQPRARLRLSRGGGARAQALLQGRRARSRGRPRRSSGPTTRRRRRSTDSAARGLPSADPRGALPPRG